MRQSLLEAGSIDIISMKLAALLAACAVLLTGAMAATTRSTTTSSRTTPTTPAYHDPDENDGEEGYTPYQGARFDNFDWRLCKLVDRNEPGNMVVSPIGVKLVLAMLYEGSILNTAREIRTTLELPKKRDDVRKIFKTVLDSLKVSGPEYVMDVGTKMYVDQSVKPRERYSNVLKTYYNSAMEQIDFTRPVEAATKINSWVDAITKGRVQNLVSGDDSMAAKVLLLVNAIFFKGLWRHPFNPEDTTTGRFQVSAGRTVPASYMKVTNKFYIYEPNTFPAKILRLPYQGKKFSMFVVLPNSPTGLNALLEKVTPDSLRQYMWNMTEGNVEVVLPKFSFKFTADLGETLKEMGIHDVFDAAARLDGVVEGGHQPAGFKVSDVLQKAGLEVGEKGTTAYGVTSVSVVSKFGEEDFKFNATHPFMFYIEDETTGTVIFVGKVVDPSKMDSIPGQFVPIPAADPNYVISTRRPSTRPRPVVPTSSPPRRPFIDEARPTQTPSRTTVPYRTTPSSRTTQTAEHRNISSLWADLYSDRHT